MGFHNKISYWIPKGKSFRMWRWHEGNTFQATRFILSLLIEKYQRSLSSFELINNSEIEEYGNNSLLCDSGEQTGERSECSISVHRKENF